MIWCKIRTECGNERVVVWEEIREELLSLDNSERGTSNREGAFVTMWFEQNGTDNEFMQCMPDYPKPEKTIWFIKRDNCEHCFLYCRSKYW